MNMTQARAAAMAAGSTVFAIGERGTNDGAVMIPHRYVRGPFAGKFVASRTKYERDYIGVDTIDQLVDYLRRGFSVRMSPIDGGAPGLITAPAIHGWR